jgi:ribosome-associated translation inhibitor RaiA
MHVHFSYQNVVRTTRIDDVIGSHLKKLDKLLAHFSPDLVHLHGTLETNGSHKSSCCSLNLALPTGQLHARQEGGDSVADLQACFGHVIAQLKKHKQALRREDSWHEPLRPAASKKKKKR